MRPFVERLNAASQGEDDSNDNHTPMKALPPKKPPTIKKIRKLAKLKSKNPPTLEWSEE